MALKFRIPERLKSRKFWLAVVSALVVFGNKAFDWGLDEKRGSDNRWFAFKFCFSGRSG